MVQAFPILGKPAASVEPSDCSFDDPAFGEDRESLGNVRPLHDLDVDLSKDPLQADLEFRPLVATIGVEFQQKRVHAEQGGHQQDAAVAVLDVRRVDNGMEQQTLRVYQDMPLLALDLLAAIVPVRVNRDPPFSALLTLWLSMIAAVGLASRSASSRHFT